MEQEKTDRLETFKQIYRTKYVQLMLIPSVIVLLAIVYLVIFYAQHGDIMNKDVSLKGGITATLYTQEEAHRLALEKELPNRIKEVNIRTIADFGSTKQTGIIIETSETDEKLLTSAIEELTSLALTEDKFSIEAMGSSLGNSFYQQMIRALILAFIGMAIVVFLAFRSVAPSLAVIEAAFCDILVTLAIVDMLGMKVSTAGIAAFLLLIGYSVDTDILLTTRLLRRSEGRVVDRVFTSIKTGLAMTSTTFITMVIGLLLTTSPVIEEIFTIVLIGLIVDVIMTYLMNGPILLIYLKRKGFEI